MEVDAILLRCLSILEAEHERRIPSLVDRYLLSTRTPALRVTTFVTCVQDLFRFRCIRNGAVQLAVAIIDARYAEPTLSPRGIASDVGLRLSTLDVTFKREMGCTISECIRERRLERSALLLVTTIKTVKEIWAETGYNHPSNFDHHFKRRFRMSPREFRAASIRPLAQRHYWAKKSAFADRPSVCADKKRVLIVDDDDCGRWTLSAYLDSQGYATSVAASGHEGLRHVKESPWDVILLDYRLGDMDGLEFLRIVRGTPLGHTPAVAIFTADLSLFDRRNEVGTLGAILASKLCGLNHVKELVECLGQGAQR